MGDRGPFHCQLVADQPGQVGQRPAQVAPVGVEDGGHLLVGGALADEPHHLPAARGQDIAGIFTTSTALSPLTSTPRIGPVSNW